jgi:hypothetical protein
MALAGQSYLAVKELEQTYRPTFLFQFQLTDGAVFFASTAHDGMQQLGGISYAGNQYLAVVAATRLGALQTVSALGLSIYGSISVDLVDSNPGWLNVERVHGFMGATVYCTLVFWDPDTYQFSSDSKLIFVGMCDPATRSGELLTVTATSIYSLSKSILPPMPIQRRCPKTFPTTFQERQQAASNPLSIFYDCGYSPDISGGTGNYSSNGPFLSCSFDKPACQARGMYDKDAANRTTRRFGGSQWEPPATWKGKSYTAGKTLQGINSENLAKYQQYVPLTYGFTWVNGVVMNVVGDPNSTRGEVVLGYGFYDNWAPDGSPLTVIINGMLVPYQPVAPDILDCYFSLGSGDRTGDINPTAIYGGSGDPYGSMYTIMPVVYSQVAQSNTPFTAQVRVAPRHIPQYTSPGHFILAETDSLAWVVLDVLRLARPDLVAKIDIQSVIDYAAICNAHINYQMADGTISNHARYKVSLSIEKPISTATLLGGAENSRPLDDRSAIKWIDLPFSLQTDTRGPAAESGSRIER